MPMLKKKGLELQHRGEGEEFSKYVESSEVRVEGRKMRLEKQIGDQS